MIHPSDNSNKENTMKKELLGAYIVLSVIGVIVFAVGHAHATLPPGTDGPIPTDSVVETTVSTIPPTTAPNTTTRPTISEIGGPACVGPCPTNPSNTATVPQDTTHHPPTPIWQPDPEVSKKTLLPETGGSIHWPVILGFVFGIGGSILMIWLSWRADKKTPPEGRNGRGW